MNQEVQNTVSCGVYLVAVHAEGKDNACVVNTLTMVALDPPTYIISLSKMAHTCDMILKTGTFTVSVLSKKADKFVLKRFGHQSGLCVDKFADFNDYVRVDNGAVTLSEGVCSYINMTVNAKVDLGSHYMFICRPESSSIVSDDDPMTYEYYYRKIKPAIDKMPNDTGKRYVYRCKCGHEYEGCCVPEDYICPVCGRFAHSFERVDNYCC